MTSPPFHWRRSPTPRCYVRRGTNTREQGHKGMTVDANRCTTDKRMRAHIPESREGALKARRHAQLSSVRFSFTSRDGAKETRSSCAHTRSKWSRQPSLPTGHNNAAKHKTKICCACDHMEKIPQDRRFNMGGRPQRDIQLCTHLRRFVVRKQQRRRRR